MGQCLSLEVAQAFHGGEIVNRKGLTSKNASSSTNQRAATFLPFKRPNNNKAPMLTIITTYDESVEVTEAPITGKTAAETPASTLPTSPLNMSIDVSDASQSHEEPDVGESEDPDEEVPDEEEEEEDEEQPSRAGGLSLAHFFQSLRHTEELDHVIPEEIDPDAPSDEEDERIAQQQEMARKLPPSTTTKPKPKVGSPPRPQDRIKMQHQRITRPTSIVNRSAPTDDDAPGSVSSHHLSEFRKLKVQVKLAARQERKKARIAKLEDRYEDVRGYNTLWESFEEIRGRAESVASLDDEEPKLKRSDSFDLQNSGSWFFDFQSMDDEDASCLDFDDDDASQSSLSLHSTASMESQRRYFEEKRKGRLSRRRRQHSDSNLFLMNQIITTKNRKQPAEDESVPTTTLYSQNHATASTPSSILRGIQKNENVAADGSENPEPASPENRGPVAPRLNVFSIATGQPEYHVYTRPGEEPVEHDSDTPKAKSRRKNASFCETEEVDMNNDYQVVRRRRVNSCSDLSSLRDERSVAESLGIHLPPSPEKRDFDYSSFAIEVITTDKPDVRVMRMQDENANRKENIVAGNAARCLEETTSAGNTPESIKQKLKRQQRGAKESVGYSEAPPPTIAYMTSEDFLRFGDSHALVNITNDRGHEIHYDGYDSSPPPNDKENDDTNSYNDTANDVTEQIDVLLSKYRNDNEDTPVAGSSDDDGAVESQVMEDPEP